MDKENFLEVCETEKANRVDLTTYRVERFSDTKNAWIFVKRKVTLTFPSDEKPNLIETDKVDVANAIDMSIYRFEIFSETRGAWMFVKRRVI